MVGELIVDGSEFRVPSFELEEGERQNHRGKIMWSESWGIDTSPGLVDGLWLILLRPTMEDRVVEAQAS